MKTNRLTKLSSALFVALGMFAPLVADAAQVTTRSAALGSSAPSVTTTHSITFTTPTGGSVGSIGFTYCTTPYNTCTTPAGLSTTSATLVSQAGATGFTINNSLNGYPYITRSASSIPPGTQLLYTLGNVVNPSAVNTEFYIRIGTFASTDTTGTAIDSGVVAVSTSQAITVTGIMPESLVFCVGTGGTDCSSMTGSTVNLGIFSPTAPSVGSSLMSASTNAGSGYVISLTGTTMASGANTITSMGAQSANGSATTSVVGTSQFGTNVRANTSPAIGADVSGLGSGTGYGTYNTVNNFRYFSGDTVASASGATKSNLYTNSYVVNVSPDQAAGTYAATMTYICTATF